MFDPKIKEIDCAGGGESDNDFISKETKKEINFKMGSAHLKDAKTILKRK